MRGVTSNKQVPGYLWQCLSGTILDPQLPQGITGTFYLPATTISLRYNVKCHRGMGTPGSEESWLPGLSVIFTYTRLLSQKKGRYIKLLHIGEYTVFTEHGWMDASKHIGAIICTLFLPLTKSALLCFSLQFFFPHTLRYTSDLFLHTLAFHHQQEDTVL